MGGLHIEWLGGNCPVQAEGSVAGKAFYFRARGVRWTMGIGGDPVGEPEWEMSEPYGGGPYDAGWMPDDEARGFIEKAAAAYLDRA